MNIRPAAVAGYFYPADPRELEREVDECLTPGPSEAPHRFERAIGCVVPHAGYRYSGTVAGAVYRGLRGLTRAIILGPNHRGRGSPLGIISSGAWSTPLGQLKIDSDLAAALEQSCDGLIEDAYAHSSEHSIEVQLPFLQRLNPEATFVPIAVGPVDFPELENLGRSIANVLRSWEGRTLIIASSDMNHYEPDGVTREKDGVAIERILTLDAAGLWQALRRERISMCGYGPAVAMITAAKELGAKAAELVQYATSADASGERDAVVGYAGIVIEKQADSGG